MKTMKKAILAAVLFLAGAFSQIMAQPMVRGGEDKPGIQYLITEYGDELELTNAQKSDLIALQIEYRNQFRPANRPMRRDDRGNFRRDRNEGRRGAKEREFRNVNSEAMQTRAEARVEMRQEVLDILTDEQVDRLQSMMLEKEERAHEFRTFRHQYIVEHAGIEGEKAEQVLSLLNAQSENRLEQARQRLQNPDKLTRDLRINQFRQLRDADDELRSILTVDEYESLRKNLGFANRPHRNERRSRRWSR